MIQTSDNIRKIKVDKSLCLIERKNSNTNEPIIITIIVIIAILYIILLLCYKLDVLLYYENERMYKPVSVNSLVFR